MKLENLSNRGKKVPASVEALNLMKGIAGESVGKRALIKIKRKLPTWTYRRVKSVWYGERATISADQMRELQRAAREKEAGDDLECLRARVERLERLLALYENKDRANTNADRP